VEVSVCWFVMKVLVYEITASKKFVVSTKERTLGTAILLLSQRLNLVSPVQLISDWS